MQTAGGGVKPLTFGQRHFGAAELGDARRTKRLVQTADAMAVHPGGSLPQKLADPGALKGLYRLMDGASVTHAAVLAPHLAHTRGVMQALGGTVLVIHDTTELDFTMKYSLEDLGQIGKGTRDGYLCHHSLAVVADTREVIGLTSQILHSRPPKKTKSKRCTIAAHRDDPQRESRLWIEGFENTAKAPPGVKQIHVCDRGADTFEVFAHLRAQGQSLVIRSTHDRLLVLPAAAAPNTPKYLHQYARALPQRGEYTLPVQANFARMGRAATVGVAAGRVTLAPPKQQRGKYQAQPLDMWVVRVWEIDPPEKARCEQPLEWFLLTAEPCPDLAAAQTVVDHYECRPIVEELHKAQKTGLEIEGMQFTKAQRLHPALALLSVVALSLLQLRDASRRPDAKDKPATDLFHPVYVETLSLWRHQEIRLEWSVHDFHLALARLGGHQNRKSDHPPGWLVLWRGWTKLNIMVLAVERERRKRQRCG